MAETTLLDVGVMFVAIAGGGAIADRLGQSVIPFYVVAGILAGPEALGRVTDAYVASGEFVEVLAELGIVFLLFFLGLEFSLDRLLANRDRITAAGTIDLAINFPSASLSASRSGGRSSRRCFSAESCTSRPAPSSPNR